MESIGMTNYADHTPNQTNLEQDWVPASTHDPKPWEEVELEREEYREGAYWKTEDGFVAIEDMDDLHVVRARRHAMQKAGEHMRLQAEHERKAETYLLKYRQLNAEAKRRGILHHQHVEV